MTSSNSSTNKAEEHETPFSKTVKTVNKRFFLEYYDSIHNILDTHKVRLKIAFSPDGTILYMDKDIKEQLKVEDELTKLCNECKIYWNAVVLGNDTRAIRPSIEQFDFEEFVLLNSAMIGDFQLTTRVIRNYEALIEQTEDKIEFKLHDFVHVKDPTRNKTILDWAVQYIDMYYKTNSNPNVLAAKKLLDTFSNKK